MEYEDHHMSDGISTLIELSRLDLVQSFVWDYLHLTLFGVMRKLILFWLHKGPISVRLQSRKINKLTHNLLYIKTCIPSDFVRKPRHTQVESNRVKAFSNICKYFKI